MGSQQGTQGGGGHGCGHGGGGGGQGLGHGGGHGLGHGLQHGLQHVGGHGLGGQSLGQYEEFIMPAVTELPWVVSAVSVLNKEHPKMLMAGSHFITVVFIRSVSPFPEL